MDDKKNKKRSINLHTGWRYFVNSWLFFLFIIATLDFITDNGFSNIVGPIAAIYAASLAIYSAEKEFERWQEYYEGRHPGELYVILWTILIVLFLILTAVFHKPYHLPPEILSTYIVVLGILAITKKSKLYYKEKKTGKKDNTYFPGA